MYLCEQDLIQNMMDAGCSEACIQEFLEQYKGGKVKQCHKILATHRQELLNHLHEEQRRIDCLDYLSYQMRTP